MVCGIYAAVSIVFSCHAIVWFKRSIYYNCIRYPNTTLASDGTVLDENGTVLGNKTDDNIVMKDGKRIGRRVHVDSAVMRLNTPTRKNAKVAPPPAAKYAPSIDGAAFEA